MFSVRSGNPRTVCRIGTQLTLEKPVKANQPDLLEDVALISLIPLRRRQVAQLKATYGEAPSERH